MGLVLIINSDPRVRKKVKKTFEQNSLSGYGVKIISREERALESLNYDLPEVVVINCEDRRLDYRRIISEARKDAWIHSFGIIGLYDAKQQKEQEIADEFRDLNLLVMLDQSRIASHLVKSVAIIVENRQLIFQRELASHLSYHTSGSFSIENDPLAVPIYAGIAATNLVQQSYIDPEKKYNLQVALSELMINAIEHGNCNITYEEKSREMGQGKTVVDMILERCEDPRVASRRVKFEWESDPDRSTFVITDEGRGFDVERVRNQVAEQDRLHPHGRGIAMAEGLCESLEYNEAGNQVTMVVAHEEYAEKRAPEGFSGEETVWAREGQVIFREGERGDFLYYIASGQFVVSHRGKEVGRLTPADVFMGEMSFLLNNKRSATVIALGEGKLLRISRRSFVQAMKQYPHYGIFLSKLLANKLARSNERKLVSSSF
jgi:anti-sigma regulatory factor (Ser/Thr protein kinase)